jgi:hypothetical protein
MPQSERKKNEEEAKADDAERTARGAAAQSQTTVLDQIDELQVCYRHICVSAFAIMTAPMVQHETRIRALLPMLLSSSHEVFH